MPTRKLAIDLAINEWTLREQMDYRTEVGVNPQFAFVRIAKAFEGFEGGVVPDAALDLPPEYLVGMAWVTMRRREPGLTFDAVVDIAGTSDALFEAFGASLSDEFGEDEDETARPTKAGKGKARTTA